MDPATPDHDSSTKEREEYMKTIDVLINKLRETEEQLEEAIKGKLDAEERLRIAEAPRGSAEEREFSAQQTRRLAEDDLRAQIKEANKYKDLYYNEFNHKRAIQEELEVCRREVEDATMRIAVLESMSG